MSFNNRFMEAAIREANIAYQMKEVPVGVVIVDSSVNQIIACASNLTENSYDPTAHAEMLAIRQACIIKKSPRLIDCDLYVTLEPCPMCAQAISFARIRRLYFGAYNVKYGGVENGARIFSSSSCHHIPEIYAGIQENECKLLLQSFFLNIRK